MPLVPPSQRTGYTLEEVAEHCTAKSLWVIINRKVYDVTAFHKRHPGGPAVLLQMGGKDATAASAAAHKNALPANLMWEFCIGSLVRFKAKAGPPDAPPASLQPPPAPVAKAKAAVGPTVALPKANAPLRGSQTSLASNATATPPAPKARPPQAPTAPAPAPATVAPITRSNTMEDAKPPRRASTVDSGRIATLMHGASGSLHEGSDDDFGAEQGSDHGDLGSEDSLLAAAALLREALLNEPRLARFADATDIPRLEEKLRGLLSSAFDGGDWPALHIKRPLVENHVGPLVEAIWETLQEPLPADEDTLAACVEQLTACQYPGVAHDQRVAAFQEALRDLLVGGRSHNRKGNRLATDLSKPSLKSLTGAWRNTDGMVCTVSDSVCTFDNKATRQLTIENGWVMLNGWKATLQAGRVVNWEKAGKKMQWTRLE